MKFLPAVIVPFILSMMSFADHTLQPGYTEVYRFHTYRNHFYTRDYNEGMAKGYRYEQTLTLYDRPFSPNQIALNRCYVPAADMVFTSTDRNCEGYFNQGVLGYVSARQQGPNEMPLYRYYKVGDNQNMDHLSTVAPQSEQLWGWRLEGVQAYVPYQQD